MVSPYMVAASMGDIAMVAWALRFGEQWRPMEQVDQRWWLLGAGAHSIAKALERGECVRSW